VSRGAMDRKGLFATILGEVPRGKGAAGEVRAISLDALSLPPSQPRRYFDEGAMDELVASVRVNGILQPLLVRPLETDRTGYYVVAGERRYRAAKRAGLSEVPAMVRPMNDEEAARYALLENLQREDLNPVEKTEGILGLLSRALDSDAEATVAFLYKMANQKKLSASRGATHNVMGSSPEEEKVVAVFDALGTMTWESFVKNRLPLLNLPDDVLDALRGGLIAYTKARVVARVKDEKKRRALLREAVEEDLPLASLRERAKALMAKSLSPPSEDLPARASSLAKHLRRRGVLRDREKRERLESLLAQMEEILKS
jgi:ParB family chromosome partitioning protein